MSGFGQNMDIRGFYKVKAGREMCLVKKGKILTFFGQILRRYEAANSISDGTVSFMLLSSPSLRCTLLPAA